MTPALVKQLGSASNKTAGTTLAHTFTGTVAAGNLIVARVLFDNFTTASKPIVSSISKQAGETANWVLLGAARSTSTSAGAFASGEMWAIQTTVNWAAASYTVTLDSSVTMKAVSFAEWSGVSATARSTAGTAMSGTTAAASATTTGTTPVVGDLALGFIFGSNVAAAQAGDNDTTGGSWSTPVGLGSTGSSAATNNFGIMQYKVLTAASHQTLNNQAVMTAGNGAIVAILQALPDPTITQAAYRWYDEGTEAGAVALAAQDTAAAGDVTINDGIGQLRIRLQNTSAVFVLATDDWQLQWEKNTSGSWANVTAASTNARGYNSPNLTEGAATTNRLGAGTGSFVAGKVTEDGLADDVGISPNNYTELLFSVALQKTDLVNGDTLRFRVLCNGATTGLTYTAVPTITVRRVNQGTVVMPWTSSLTAVGSRISKGTITATHSWVPAAVGDAPPDPSGGAPTPDLWYDASAPGALVMSGANVSGVNARGGAGPNVTAAFRSGTSVGSRNGLATIDIVEGDFGGYQGAIGSTYTGNTVTAIFAANFQPGNSFCRIISLRKPGDTDWGTTSSVAFGTLESAGTVYPAIYRGNSGTFPDGLNTGWHVVRQSVEGSNSYVYIDGVLRGSSTSAANPFEFSVASLLGVVEGAGNSFRGSFGEVRTFNKALTAPEAAAVEEELTAKWITPPPSGFLKVRRIAAGTAPTYADSDFLHMALGEVASTVVRPYTWVLYSRVLEAVPGDGTSLIQKPSPGHTIDFYYYSNDLRSHDGGTELSFGITNPPINTWTIHAFRVSDTGVVQTSRWVDGVGWNHRPPSGTSGFASGSWPATGTLDFYSYGADADYVVAANWDGTVLSNAQLETLTTDFVAWQVLNPSHLWRFDETPPNDLVGTMDFVSAVGTTLPGIDSALPVGTPPKLVPAVANFYVATDNVLNRNPETLFPALADGDYVIAMWSDEQTGPQTITYPTGWTQKYLRKASDSSAAFSTGVFYIRRGTSPITNYTFSTTAPGQTLIDYIMIRGVDPAATDPFYALDANYDAVNDNVITWRQTPTATDALVLGYTNNYNWGTRGASTWDDEVWITDRHSCLYTNGNSAADGVTPVETVVASYDHSALTMVFRPVGAPAIIYSDAFTRADGALGTPWVTQTGSSPPSISINRATVTVGSGDSAAYYDQSFSNDQWSEVDVTAPATNGILSAAVRLGPTFSDPAYYTWYSGGNLQLWKRSAPGTYAQLGGNIPAPSQYRVRLEVEGTAVRVFLNDTQVISVTDTSVTTGKPGLQGGNYGTQPYADNFRCGDLPYVAPPTPAPVLHYDFSDPAARTMSGGRCTAIASQAGLGVSLNTGGYTAGYALTTSPSGRECVLYEDGAGFSGALTTPVTGAIGTLCVVYRFRSGREWGRIVSLANAGPDWQDSGSLMFVRDNARVPSVNKGNGGGSQSAVFPDSSYEDIWSVVTYTIDNGAVVIRLNGTVIKTGTLTMGSGILAARLGLGGQASGTENGDSFRGELCEVKLWNSVLPVTAIAEQETLLTGRWISAAVTPATGTAAVTYSSTIAAAGGIDSLFTDNFNRADGDLGPNWVTLPGVPVEPVISGNHVIPSGTAVNNGLNVVGTYGANQWGRVASSLGTGYSEAGVLLHSTDADHTMSFIYTTDGEPYGPGVFGSVNGPAIQLYFLTGAGPVFRFLGETPAPGTGTHVVFGCNVGRQIQLWFDGVRVFNVDDSAHTELPLVAAPGFTIHRAGTGVETIVDDFAGGDWVVGPLAPTITFLSPSSIAATGATVTVAGTNFIQDATMATIEGVNYPMTVASPTSGTFVAPAHAAGAVTVTVTSVGGTSAGSPLTYTTVAANSGAATITWTVTSLATGKRVASSAVTTVWNESVTTAVGKRVPKSAVTSTYVESVPVAVGKKAPKSTTDVTTYTESVSVAIGKRVPKSTVTTTYTESTPVAAGKRVPKSAITTTHTWVTAAQGVAPIVGVKQGTATVTYTESVPTSAGKKIPVGATTPTTYTENLVAQGKKLQKSSVTTTWTENLTATGKKAPQSPATTTYTETTTATGKRTTQALALLTHSWSSTANGFAPTVGVKQGFATITYTENLTAQGKKVTGGGALVTNTWTSTASGKKFQKSSVVTTYTEVLTAVGKKAPKSTLTTAYTFSVLAQGKKFTRGTAATITHTWTRTAQGVAPIVGFSQGTALVTSTWSGTATGKKAPRGLAPVVTVTWSTSATGKKFQRATALVDYRELITATGKKVPSSGVVITYTVNLTAAGKRSPKGRADPTYRYTVAALGLSGIAGFVEAIWNDQEVVEMMYGDKQVVEWLLVPS